MVTICAYAVFLFGFFLLFYEVWWSGKRTGAVVTAGAALVVAGFVFINPTQFEQLSAFGMNAKLRATVQEAQATIQQLRGFAVPVTRELLDGLSRLGKWDSFMSEQDMQRMRSEFGEALREMGLDDSQIAEALGPGHGTEEPRKQLRTPDR